MITAQWQSEPGNRRHHGRWLLLLLGLAGASMASADDFPGNQFDMDLAPFEVVELLGEATVRLVQGEENSVQATGDTGRLEVSVDGGVLTIDTTKARARHDQRLMIVLNYDDLQAIRSHGDMRVLATDMALSELTLSGSGSSKFDLQNVELGRLDVHGAGAQHFQLSGAVATQAIRMIGASEFNGMDLDAVSATVVINGAGRASVASRNTLDIEILGVGNVAYRGDPEITARILGPGTVAGLEG
ncbi:MAG: DUF2807 domain-containing protein [Pseudomonadaceae bacterium]|nr:DUF2807 domain-containing protein [Pseudomonadaceae bacterium]